MIEPPNYSDDNWAEIDSSIRSVRPGQPLTDHERRVIWYPGHIYLFLSNGREWLKQDVARFVENWSNIHRLAGELATELAEADDRARNAKRPSFGGLIKTLVKLQDRAARFAERRERYRFPEKYYHDVFSLWLKFGGKLRYSRNSGKLSGPLIRFFQAVTGPVLGTDAPALESIKDIIEREKHRQRKQRERAMGFRVAE
jgi:hypothetical protein